MCSDTSDRVEQNGIIYRKGTSPEAMGYPGFGYRSSQHEGILIEKDVAVPLRDGSRIYVDLFRPIDAGPVPPLISWGPYGKHFTTDYSPWPGSEVDVDANSAYTTFEAIDPIAWAQAGYAVIVADIRGTWACEGDASFFSSQEARDEYDLIEWAGTQSWSNGKVGLAGVSYLAISQWMVAALRPPHLAAINPWEGFSNPYFDSYFHGGIPGTQFSDALQNLTTSSLGLVEDLAAMMRVHPLYDEYWQDKATELENIEVPAFIVGSWSDQGCHTRGVFQAYSRIGSPKKWLFVHGRKKWNTFYAEESVRMQHAFFDKFLKGDDTEVDSWPPVRIEIRESYCQGMFRDEDGWPLTRTRYQKLHLTTSGILQPEPDPTEGQVTYDSETGSARFDITFGSDTEITGHTELKLWLSAPDADDADVFVALQKIDRDGQVLGFPFFSSKEDGQVALGWLRASHRELDDRSKPGLPVHPHQRLMPLDGDQPVLLSIEILPSSTLFRAGETLRLLIQGTDINKYPSGFVLGHHELNNRGRHVLHLGGQYESHLLVPVIPED